jgi:gp16 family phage-associated protein
MLHFHVDMVHLLTNNHQQLNNCQLTVGQGERMSKLTSESSTNVRRVGSVLTGEQAKARVYARGMTLVQFAEANGFKYRTVCEVVRGLNRGLYGEGHKVAIALHMK